VARCRLRPKEACDARSCRRRRVNQAAGICSGLRTPPDRRTKVRNKGGSIMRHWNRRQFLHQVAGFGTGVIGLGLARRFVFADEPAKVSDHTLTVIAGKPRERGKAYGQKFNEGIRAFLDKEIYQACSKQASREELLRYAGQCTKAIKEYSPII